MSSAETAKGIQPPTQKSARLVLAALALIVLAGLVLRTTGIGFLLPHQTEPDGVVLDKQVEILRDGKRANVARHLNAFYPHLVARIAALVPQPGPEATAPRTLDEHLERARVHRRNIRLVVAWLSLLAIPGTWWLARRFMPDAWALIAAALVATSVFTIWFAQQARPHAAEASFALLAVIAAMGVRRSGTWRSFAIAGVASGLAIGCLQNGLAVLPALAVAAFLRARTRAGSLGKLALQSALALALAALVALCFYPFLFDVPPKAGVASEGSFFKFSGHIVDLAMFNGRGFATVARSLWEYDPLIAALALLGLACALVDVVRRRDRAPDPDLPERRDALLVVLAYVVPYAIAIGLYQRTYQRFALPLVPFECALAAFGLWRGTSAAARSGTTMLRLVAGAAVALVLFQAYAAWKLSDVRARPDTITETARWIEANVKPGARVSVLPSIDLPLMQAPNALEANEMTTMDPAFPWYVYQWDMERGSFDGPVWNLIAMPLSTEPKREAARADPAAFVRAQDADYVVMEVFSGARRPFLGRLRDTVAAQGELVARISPDGTDRGENLPLVYQDDEFPYTTPWFARILGARCVGPIVEIYKLR
jgi:hypothetical protein